MINELESRLQAAAEKVVDNETYYIPLTPEELTARRQDFVENQVQISDLDEEMKQLVAEKKAAKKVLTTENAALMTEIRTKQQRKVGRVYHVPDYETGVMNRMTPEGEIIDTRKLRPEEKKGQKGMFSDSKFFVPDGYQVREGTND